MENRPTRLYLLPVPAISFHTRYISLCSLATSSPIDDGAANYGRRVHQKPCTALYAAENTTQAALRVDLREGTNMGLHGTNLLSSNYYAICFIARLPFV